MLRRLAKEPPFRILVRAALKYLKPSIQTRCDWEISDRPFYLLGLLEAAIQARKQDIRYLTAIEFGVAGGDGLLAMEYEAEAVHKATGVYFEVVGFDAGPSGLPSGTGDYRDHPDLWQPGDYPMDVAALKRRLKKSTRLILGNVRETLSQLKVINYPLGFVSFDMDLYSSTRDALKVFDIMPMLPNTICYFDDITYCNHHRWAGELLAIDEFNASHDHIKIDKWYGVRTGKPFPERSYFERMYVAHDLQAISQYRVDRSPHLLRLTG